MRLPELPERLVVIGGGYIAAELGHVFAGFGTKVTFVNRGPLPAAVRGRRRVARASPSSPPSASTSLLDTAIDRVERAGDGTIRVARRHRRRAAA